MIQEAYALLEMTIDDRTDDCVSTDREQGKRDRPPVIGVLSLQGDFARHFTALEEIGLAGQKLRDPEGLADLDGLVLPGGESTTIGKLLRRYNIWEPLQERIRTGLPVLATCAGMVLLSREIAGRAQESLGILDIVVERNGYGRQLESFEGSVSTRTEVMGREQIPGLFIRAPRILKLGEQVQVLGTQEEEPVLVRQGNVLAASFHPELTEDRTVQMFFLNMIQAHKYPV